MSEPDPGARVSAVRLTLVAPCLPSERTLSDAHLEQLHASGLTDETIGLACLYTERHAHRLAALVQWRSWPSVRGEALVFPFFLDAASEPYAYRIRPTNPRMIKKKNGKEKPVKYDQASAYGQLVYYTPRARAGGWYGEAERTLYWTEGEKKALVFDQLGLPCVGLTGVSMWVDAQGKADHGARLHPLITERVAIAGRRHVIVFDADAEENNDVMREAARLTGVLLAAGATEVLFTYPPDARSAKGFDDFYAAHGEAAARALLTTAKAIEPLAPQEPLARIKSLAALRDAPIPDTMRMPVGYDVQRDGSLWRQSSDDKRGPARVTHAPLFPVRVLTDHYTHEERVEIVYPRGEAWPLVCVARKAVADSRTMVAECAPYGVPVTSVNAAKIVEWLSECEAANANTLPRVPSVGQMGWHDIGGARVITTNTIHQSEVSTVSIAIDTRGERARILAALTPRGDYEAHLVALRQAWSADATCAVMICAAFAAPLLKPLHAANFAVHLPGDSSRGKTSMLKIAASVFGDPNSPQWVGSWNVTPAAAELRASIMNDLPQCYDEIGGGDAQAIERMVYALINGGGRSRATREMAMRETTSWRTILLSTGERELADEATATGAQIRVVQLPVSGFGELTAAQVDALREACAANSGQAGAVWCDAIVNMDDSEWIDTRSVLRDTTAALRTLAADPLQARVASYFGLLAVTESILHNALGIGTATGATMKDVFKSLARGDSDSRVRSVAERAHDIVMDWIAAEPEAFPEVEAIGFDRSGAASGKPGTRHGYRRTDGAVLFIPTELDRKLRKHRLATRQVLRDWKRLGWISTEGVHLARRHTVQGGQSRIRLVYLTHTNPPPSESES